VLVSVLIASAAQADLITLDAASVGLGVDVSNVFDGLTMQRIRTPSAPTPPAQTINDLLAGPVITSEPHYGDLAVSFGQFDAGYGNAYLYCYLLSSCSNVGFFSVLELTLDVPTHFVQITGDAAQGLPPIMYAFGQDGALLATCNLYQNSPGCEWTFTEIEDDSLLMNDVRQTVSLTSDQRDIARVVFGGSTGGAQVNQISYAVPEPSTLLLAGIGAAFLISKRAQRR